MSAQQSFMDKTVKAGVTGAIGALASYVMGESSTMAVGSMIVPTPLVIGVSTGASSIVADYAGEMWYPDTPESQRLMSISSGAVGLGVAGASASLLLNQGFGDNSLNAFALGAASYAAGDWITNKFINPPEVVRY